MNMNTSYSIAPVNKSIDETTILSVDSIYATPEVSTLFFPDLSLTSNIDEAKNLLYYESTPSLKVNTRDIRADLSSKLTVDKENLGYSYNKKYAHRHSESTPLRCVTNIASLSNTPDVVADTPIEKVKLDADYRKTTKSLVKKKQRYFPKIGFLSKNKLNQQVSKDSRISAISLNADGESIVIRIPNKSYGTIYCDIKNEHDQVQTSDLITATQLETKCESTGESSSLVLVNSETVRKNVIQKSWNCFVGRPVSLVFQKISVSPVKRLFARSVHGIYSCYEKYIKKKKRFQYETLDVTDEKDPKPHEDVIQFLTRELEPLKNSESTVSNIEKLMGQMLSKLNSVENEVKELKCLLKENNIPKPLGVPPPPPPPPFPSLSMLSLVSQNSTPKRKADLVTPEYNQTAKRPHAQEQRTQFSITVEDLRNVKLRKTGNRVIKKKCSTNTEISLSANTRGARKNRFAKKDLSEIAAEILSPRKLDRQNESGGLSSPNTAVNNNSSSNNGLNLFEQTPKVRSRYRSAVLCSGKRKDWTGDSPVRKRLNSSNCLSPQRRLSLTESVQ